MTALWKLTLNDPDEPARVKLYRKLESAEAAARDFWRPGMLMSIESVTEYNPYARNPQEAVTA